MAACNAYSRIRSQPITKAINSPNARYAYEFNADGQLGGNFDTCLFRLTQNGLDTCIGLKATTREEKFFGDNLFRDWRYNADGSLNEEFVLNNPTYGGQVLVAGKNFGSGSSREHAAWAIAGYGFRVVVSSFFADIHKNNELNNFVLPVVVTEGFLQELFDSIYADPKMEVEVNLPEQTITNKATGKSEHFEINAYKKLCLMNGLDDIDFLLSNKNKIEEWENKASK